MIPLSVLTGLALLLAPAVPQDQPDGAQAPPTAPLAGAAQDAADAGPTRDAAPVAPTAADPTLAGAAGDALRLQLHEAVTSALQNNPALQGALLDAESAWAGYGAAWGAFDASFFSTLTKRENISAPAPATFVGGINVGGSPSTEVDVLTWRTGLRGQFETGTQWEIGVGPTWVRTQASGGPRIDIFTAAADVSLTQPLLRGGADGYAKSAVELAVRDANMAAVDAERVASDTLESVVTAYWNLVFADQNVATRQLSVALSEELLGITRRKYEQGLQNRLDVVEVEAELANRRAERLTAVQQHEKAMDDLRALILAPEETEQWARPLQAGTAWDEAVELIAERLGALDQDSAMVVALRERPDVRRARLSLERAEIALERAETDALPRLDATASYGLNSNQPSQGRALRRLNDTSFHEASIFLDFEMPLGNRQAGYAEHQRRLERERALVALRETEVAALTDVRDALRSVQLQTETVRSAAETVRLRREVYEGERRRLENDLSTPYQVREFQRDLLEAIDNETRAQLDLAVAWTRLVAAQGLLVGQSGYELPRQPVSADEAPAAP